MANATAPEQERASNSVIERHAGDVEQDKEMVEDVRRLPRQLLAVALDGGDRRLHRLLAELLRRKRDSAPRELRRIGGGIAGFRPRGHDSRQVFEGEGGHRKITDAVPRGSF